MPVQDFGELYAHPSKFRLHLMKVLGGSALLALVVTFFADQRLALFLGQSEVHDLIWQPARTITNIGLSEYYFLGAFLSWSLAKWAAPRLKRLQPYASSIDFARRWGLNALAALVLSGVFTHLLKFLAGRQRPHKSPVFDPFVFDPLTTHWHWHSFSSGHSQVMFTVATMLCVALPRFRWLWISFAVFICATRVIIHDHFFSDVIFGACVGYVGSLLAMKLMQTKTQNGLFPL